MTLLVFLVLAFGVLFAFAFTGASAAMLGLALCDAAVRLLRKAVLR